MATSSKKLPLTQRLSCPGVAPSRLAGFLPATEVERDRHTCGTQLIRYSAIDHGPGHDHASNGERPYAARRSVSAWIFPAHASSQDVDHGFEYGFESEPRVLAAARNIGQQRNHRARVLYVLEMLAG
jgi:hypothetical protein